MSNEEQQTSKLSNASRSLISSEAQQTSDTRREQGALGEALAESYLLSQGYLLEAKNWRGTRGELDLVMCLEDILVIIEVRSTSKAWLERPCEATSPRKQRQVARCADEYISQRPAQFSSFTHIRFDVIGILIPNLHQPSEYQIDHVENAFSSPWAY